MQDGIDQMVARVHIMEQLFKILSVEVKTCHCCFGDVQQRNLLFIQTLLIVYITLRVILEVCYHQ